MNVFGKSIEERLDELEHFQREIFIRWCKLGGVDQTKATLENLIDFTWNASNEFREVEKKVQEIDDFLDSLYERWQMIYGPDGVYERLKKIEQWAEGVQLDFYKLEERVRMLEEKSRPTTSTEATPKESSVRESSPS